MQKKSFPRLSAAIAAALASAIPGRWALGDTYLDQIGLTQLRAEVPTLTGAGVTIAQPEATTVDEGTNFDHDNYQVNALTAGVGATITYLGTSGTFQSFSLVQESGHANVVAKYLASTTNGVAPGISRLLNINANWYANGYILPNNAIPFSPKVLNQSFSETPSGPYTAPILDQIWDSYAVSRNVIIVTAAGNGGAIVQPGTAYNVISVGVYPSGFSSVSSPGDRAKPDIVAPVDSWDRFSSFTTPVVSGAAALMVQAAGGSGVGTDPRVVKSILLNGAVKPGGWTHSSTVPLDRGYGAGVLNVYNSYKNLTAGQKNVGATTFTVSLGGSHGAVNSASNAGLAGWNLGTITSTVATDAVDHYILDLSTASALTTITSTLTWMRANNTALTNEIKNSSATTSSFTTAPNTINNLDLYLYKINSGAQADLSISAIDNVEHLFTLNLTPGKYDLQVLKNGGLTGTANVFSNAETYGLAWNVATQSTATNSGVIVFNQTHSVSISTSIAGGGALSHTGIGTTTLSATYSGTGSITVNAGKLIFANSTSSRGTAPVLIETSALSVNASLDVSNHDVLVHNGNTSALEAQIGSAFNGGLWNGPGITSSSAMLDNRTTLGIASGADLAMAGMIIAIDTKPFTSTDTVIKYTYLGDINLDGLVNDDDLFQFLGAYLGSQAGHYFNGDLNYDGTIDDDDLFAFLGNYLNQPTSPLGEVAISSHSLASVSAIPEPASLILLSIGMCGVMLTRRRRPLES